MYSGDRRARASQHGLERARSSQILSLRDFGAKHLTTVLAFIAFTFTVCPNMTLVPAWVAGLTFVLIITTPGTTNLPVFFTCEVARGARAPKTCPTPFLSTP